MSSEAVEMCAVCGATYQLDANRFPLSRDEFACDCQVRSEAFKEKLKTINFGKVF